MACRRGSASVRPTASRANVRRNSMAAVNSNLCNDRQRPGGHVIFAGHTDAGAQSTDGHVPIGVDDRADVLGRSSIRVTRIDLAVTGIRRPDETLLTAIESLEDFAGAGSVVRIARGAQHRDGGALRGRRCLGRQEWLARGPHRVSCPPPIDGVEADQMSELVVRTLHVGIQCAGIGPCHQRRHRCLERHSGQKLEREEMKLRQPFSRPLFQFAAHEFLFERRHRTAARLEPVRSLSNRSASFASPRPMSRNIPASGASE